jgi:chloramphenicol-sensitive protein RarD
MGFATAAYVVWGVVPVYWKNIESVPALEVLAPRIVCTGLLMAGVLVVTRRTRELREFDRAGLLRALLAATLLSLNWLTFIYAVQTERVLATSLGYYINPLVSTVLGLVVLRERINNVQGLAVVLAGLGVAYLTFAAGGLPWIAIVLALSFGLYGLVHKLAPSPPLAGLGVEMWIVTPVAVLGWLWLAARGEATLVDASASLRWLVAASAIVTALPLLCFHAATRRLPLYAVGMFQYIAPTLSLLLAVRIYGEAFSSAHAVCFGCVWTGLAIFTGDSRARARRPGAAGADVTGH